MPSGDPEETLKTPEIYLNDNPKRDPKETLKRIQRDPTEILKIS